MASNKNSEHFSFHLGNKLKLDANQPGKETRKTLALVGFIVIVILALVIAALYFLKINLVSAGLFGGIAAAGDRIIRWTGKGRSP